MLKLRPRTNGQPMPGVDQAMADDAADEALAKRIANEAPLPCPEDDLSGLEDIPELPPMPKQAAQRAPQQPPRPKSDPQALLDTIVVAVLEERIGVIEQGDKIYLTEWIQADNIITLRTLGTLGLGGRTVIRGSNVTK